MTISEAARHALHTRLGEVLGEEEAVVLMEHLPPVAWADVATKRDLDHLAIEIRGELAELRGQIRLEMSAQVRAMYMGMVGTMLSSVGAVAAAVALVR